MIFWIKIFNIRKKSIKYIDRKLKDTQGFWISCRVKRPLLDVSHNAFWHASIWAWEKKVCPHGNIFLTAFETNKPRGCFTTTSAVLYSKSAGFPFPARPADQLLNTPWRPLAQGVFKHIRKNSRKHPNFSAFRPKTQFLSFQNPQAPGNFYHMRFLLKNTQCFWVPCTDRTLAPLFGKAMFISWV